MEHELDPLTHLNEQVVLDFLTESLRGNDALAVEAHIETCQRCRLLMDQAIDPDGLANRHLSVSRQDNLRRSELESAVLGTSCADGVPPVDGSNFNPDEIEKGGRFVVLNELGRGGMGIVYRGFDRQLKRQVAIKVIGTTSNGDAQLRFYREAQITGQLQHPGIVPIHELGI